ncbi:hypothetical protein V8E55_005805, partial [Tylopilus felleus]
KDLLAFNRNVLDETEVVCQWVHNGALCSEHIRARNFRIHLHGTHGVISDAPNHTYLCRWDGCPSNLQMRRTSLERHMKEQHVPFRWVCPSCTQIFSREYTLLAHMERVHEYVSP